MWLGNPVARHVAEVPVTVIPIQVNARKITHHHQVQVAVTIQVRKRSAIHPPPPLLLQSRPRRPVLENPSQVVQQQIPRVSVVRVKVMGSEDLAQRGNSILTNEYIEVSVAI